jgi:plasmid maintenance system antidote protein VapI
MREIREAMHLPVRSLARWTDRAESTLRAMEAGQRPIPADLAAWLAGLGRWQEKHPPPKKTR